MKICVLGLDGATPDIFQDERLANIRRLMDMGVYGKLKTIAQAGTVPIWMSMGSSQAEAVDAKSTAIWTLLGDNENRAALIGLISDLPPYEVNGVSFASFPPPPNTPVTETIPESIADPSPHSLTDQVSLASRTRWQTARSLFSQQRWAYFQVVDLGLQTFAVDSADPQAISHYHLWLDEQVGSMLELLDDETLLLIVSPRGMGPSAEPDGDGMFVLIAPNCPLSGEYQGATLLDMAPTMLDLVGRDIPSSMQGKSLVAQMQKKGPDAGADIDEEALLRDRLAGLGYI